MTADRLRAAQRMQDDGETVTTIAEVLGVSRATIYRHLHQALDQSDGEQAH